MLYHLLRAHGAFYYTPRHISTYNEHLTYWQCSQVFTAISIQTLTGKSKNFNFQKNRISNDAVPKDPILVTNSNVLIQVTEQKFKLDLHSLSSFNLQNTQRSRLFCRFVIMVKQSTLLVKYCWKDDEVRDFVCGLKEIIVFYYAV